MTTIAHLSDLHVLEADLHGRSTTERLRLSYLTATRRKSAALRRAQVKRSLEAASRAGADHVVLTGDLTEEGTPRQFELLAELLHESGLPPERVTLVPGNHDAYDDARAFENALSGPLAPFAANSARGATTIFGDVVIMAVSTAVHQSWLTSWGAMGADQYAPILGAKRRFGGRAVILAQHHPPMHRGAMHWIDGLRDTARLMRLLEGHPHVHVLHGHLHRERERALSPLGAPQIFGVAPAFDSRAPLKLYDIIDGQVVPRRRPSLAA